MSTKPMVSIITPVFNAARLLPETIASVQAQTYSNWEHLLVDDGSEDGSAAIVEAAASRDQRVRLLRTARNMGPSAARNLGIGAARGRFIALIDADDLWLPEKLSRSVDWIAKSGHPFIYHDYRYISSDGKQIGPLIKAPERLDLRSLHTRRGFGCLSIVLDRERVKDFTFPAECDYLHEDFCAWLSLVRRGCVGRRLPEDLGRYRLSSQSRSSRKLYAAHQTWRIYRDVSGLSWNRAARWWLQYAWNAFWLHRYAAPRFDARRFDGAKTAASFHNAALPLQE